LLGEAFFFPGRRAQVIAPVGPCGCGAANAVEFWRASRWQAVEEPGDEVSRVAASKGAIGCSSAIRHYKLDPIRASGRGLRLPAGQIVDIPTFY